MAEQCDQEVEGLRWVMESAALGQLAERLKKIRRGGAILELGAQDINADVPEESLLSILTSIHGSLEKGQRAALCLPKQRPIRAAELFRDSDSAIWQVVRGISHHLRAV